VHYCVANMSGAAPLTSTYCVERRDDAFVLALADKGVERAFAEDPGFAAGLNVTGGQVVHPAVAAALDLPLAAA
jgi:alanine dehydrogenase